MLPSPVSPVAKAFSTASERGGRDVSSARLEGERAQGDQRRRGRTEEELARLDVPRRDDAAPATAPLELDDLDGPDVVADGKLVLDAGVGGLDDLAPVVLARRALMEHALDTLHARKSVGARRVELEDAAVRLARRLELAQALERLGAAQRRLELGERGRRDVAREEAEDGRRVAQGRGEVAEAEVGLRAVEEQDEALGGVVACGEAVRVSLDGEEVLLGDKVAVAERLEVERGGARRSERGRRPLGALGERVLRRQDLVVGRRLDANDVTRPVGARLVRRLAHGEDGAAREELVEVGPGRHAVEREVVDGEHVAASQKESVRRSRQPCSRGRGGGGCGTHTRPSWSSTTNVSPTTLTARDKVFVRGRGRRTSSPESAGRRTRRGDDAAEQEPTLREEERQRSSPAGGAVHAPCASW